MSQAKNVLIIGGAGYIGSHVNLLLSQKGYRTIILDNLVHGHRDAVQWGTFIEGDMADTSLLSRVFEEYEIDAVMHFSAFIAVGESVEEPGSYYKSNVARTIDLLNATVQAGIKYFLFSSTCAIMGNPVYLPLDEKHKRDPLNPYGWSKFMVEQILQDFESAYGLRHGILRYFNAAGAESKARIGERHDPETHLIPIVLEAALGKREEVGIFGTDYPTRDGTCIRDYIHVCDLAEAHLLTLEWMMEHDASNDFNLGNGKGFTVKEVIDVARRVTNREIQTRETHRRDGDAESLIGSSEKAKAVLGWIPKIDSLEEIVSSAWRWHRKVEDLGGEDPENG